MHVVPHHHRLPSAGIDPIDRHELGLDVVTRIAAVPRRSETIVVLLDDARRALAVVVVTDTVRPDAVLDVVELVTVPTVLDGRVDAVVVGSVRPGGGVEPGDLDRWFELSAIVDDHGAELLEWFVLDDRGASCPRDLVGETPRW
jgi:hypothetical protein